MSVRVLVRRCLEKDRTERLHDIGDARIEIKEALATPLMEVVEREAFHRRDPYRKTWEQTRDSGKGVQDLRQQAETRRQQELPIGLQVGGLATIAAGIGTGVFLYFLVPDRPVYVVGVIPFLVGLVLVLYGFVLVPRPPASGPP